MKCPQVQDLLPDYAVKLLDGRTHREVESHLAACNDCRTELEAQDAAMALVEQFGAAEPPVGLFNAVRNRIEAGNFERERPAWWAFLFTRPARAAAMGLAMGAVAFGLLAPAGPTVTPQNPTTIVLKTPGTTINSVADNDISSSVRQHALSAGQSTLPDRVAWEAMAQILSPDPVAPKSRPDRRDKVE